MAKSVRLNTRHLADQIRKHILSEMTVEELAEASGVSLKEINDILGSRIKDVHRWTAEKLAEGAGLNVAIIGTEAYFHTMKNPGSK